MNRVIERFAAEHDLRLIAVAVVLSAIVAIASTVMSRRTMTATGRRHAWWLMASGIVVGVGLWGADIVSFLAFEPPVPVQLDLVATAAALVIMIVVSLSGWILAGVSRSARASLAAAALIGAGIVSMRFINLTSLQTDLPVRWDAVCAVLALSIGMVGNVVSVYLGTRYWNRLLGIAGVGVFVLSMFVAQQVAVGAMMFDDAGSAVPADPALKLLAITLALATISIVGTGLVMAAFDLHLGDRKRAESRRMRTLVDATFEALVVVRGDIIIDMNKRFGELLKLSRRDLVELPLSKVAADESSVERLFNASDVQPQTCRLRCRHGTEISGSWCAM